MLLFDNALDYHSIIVWIPVNKYNKSVETLSNFVIHQ